MTWAISKQGEQTSLAQLVLCDAIIDWLSHAVCDVEISNETLALDVIDHKGTEGNYLDEDHTVDHFRERWLPGILDQSVYDVWKTEGSQSLGDRLNRRVEEILAKHKPPPLPPHIKAKVHAVLDGHAGRLKSG